MQWRRDGCPGRVENNVRSVGARLPGAVGFRPIVPATERVKAAVGGGACQHPAARMWRRLRCLGMGGEAGGGGRGTAWQLRQGGSQYDQRSKLHGWPVPPPETPAEAPPLVGPVAPAAGTAPEVPPAIPPLCGPVAVTEGWNTGAGAVGVDAP